MKNLTFFATYLSAVGAVFFLIWLCRYQKTDRKTARSIIIITAMVGTVVLILAHVPYNISEWQNIIHSSLFITWGGFYWWIIGHYNAANS